MTEATASASSSVKQGQGETDVSSISVGHHGAGRIADHHRPRGDVLGHHGAHSDHRMLANHQRLLAGALAKQRSGADIGMASDMDVAVAPYGRGEGHEIADPAVVLDIRIEVRVEAAADPDVGREGDEWGNERARADFDIVHLDAIACPDFRDRHGMIDTTLIELLA